MAKGSIRPGKDDHASVSVRQISNGFVASQARSGAKGYEHTETFHPTAPKITVSVAKPVAKPAGSPAKPAKPGPAKTKSHPAFQRY